MNFVVMLPLWLVVVLAPLWIAVRLTVAVARFAVWLVVTSVRLLSQLRA